MKKHIKFFLIAVIGTMFGGCSPNSPYESSNVQTKYETEITTESEIQIVEDSSKTETEEQSVSLENIPYQLQIEKLLGSNGTKSGKLFIIDDLLKLKQCIDYLDFEENKKLLEKYNEKWFETNVLLVSTFGMGSDFRLEMNRMMIEDDCLCMNVEYIHTGWEKLSEVERERREEAKDYPTFLTDYREWGSLIEIEMQYSEWIKAVSRVVAECTIIPSYGKEVIEMELEIADAETK